MRRKIYVGLLAALALALGGCGSTDSAQNRTLLIREPYEGNAREAATVVRGDLQPLSELPITGVGMKNEVFCAAYDGMKVKEVFVTEGDMVEDGTLLISFESEDIDKELQHYSTDKQDLLLQKEHLEKLLAIEENAQIRNNLSQIERDIATADMYVRELSDKKRSLNLYAHGTGMVVGVKQNLKGTEIKSSETLVRVTYGDGIYKCETDIIFPFEIGKDYTARYGNANYILKLTEIGEAATPDKKKLTFVLDSENGLFCPWDFLKVDLIGESLEDVLIIPDSCVVERERGTYAAVLGSDGFTDYVPIKCGPSAEGVVVVEEGLEEGWQVIKW